MLDTMPSLHYLARLAVSKEYEKPYVAFEIWKGWLHNWLTTDRMEETSAVSDALERMPAIINLCQETQNPLLSHLSQNLDCLSDMAEEIRHTLVDEPPLSIRDGGLIRKGLSETIDQLRETSASGHTWFRELEEKLRKELDIPSLKVKMNRQIGWFIEVTKSNEEKVPEEWRRKQQMTNGSRYVTVELAERDDLLLTADTKVKELEYREFTALRENAKCMHKHSQISLVRLQP